MYEHDVVLIMNANIIKGIPVLKNVEVQKKRYKYIFEIYSETYNKLLLINKISE